MKLLTVSKIAFSLMFFIGLAITGSYITLIGAFEQQVVPEFLFWFGVCLLSSSLVLLWAQEKKATYLLLLISITSFFIYFYGFLRAPFFGTDIVGEYYTASITQQLGKWPINLIGSQPFNSYFSCLSVTVFPTMVSDLTGLPMFTVYKIIVPLMATFITISVFLVIRAIFNEKIAALSTIAFILTGNSALLAQLLREDVALFFLFLCMYLLLARGGLNKRSSLFLVFLFLLSIPIAHYTIVYFTLLFLLAVFVVDRLKNQFYSAIRKLRLGFQNVMSVERESEKSILRLEILLFSIVAGLVWLTYIGLSIFEFDMRVVSSSLRALIGLSPARYSLQVTFAGISSLGISQTIITWIVRALTVIGFFLALRVSISVRKLAFTLWGGLMLLVLAIDWAVPVINQTLALDRVYLIGLIAFSAFIGLALVEISKKISRPRIKSWVVLLPVVVMVAMFFASFVPMTYLPESAATQQYTLSPVPHQISQRDLSFSQWIQNNTSTDTVFYADFKGYQISEGFAFRKCSYIYPRNSTEAFSRFEDSLSLNQTVIFSTIFETGVCVGFPAVNVPGIFIQFDDVNALLKNYQADVAFSNGRSILIATR